MFWKHIKFFVGTSYFRSPDEGGSLGDLATLTSTETDNESTDEKTDDTEKEGDEESDSKDEGDTEGDEDTGEDTDENEEDDEEKDEEDKDEKDESETEGEDEEDRVTHVSDIKKSYPDFFKKFPDVKAALYRDQQYSEIFGSPKDAQLINEKAGVFDQINEDLIGTGDPSKLLTAIKKESNDSYAKVALAVLPFIAKNDKELYLKVAALPIKQLLRAAFREGGKDDKGNLSNLAKAAQYVHQYYFDNIDIDRPLDIESTSKDEKSEKEKLLEQRLTQIEQKEYNNFFDSVNQSYVSKLSKEFRSTIENDERLTEWMKSRLVDDGLREIRKQLDNDPRYSNQMKSLWNQAKQTGYTNDIKSRILNTALARAKSLVPSLRSRLINEALGKGKKKDNKDKDNKSEKKIEFKPRENRSSTERKLNTAPRKPLSDLDILRGA